MLSTFQPSSSAASDGRSSFPVHRRYPDSNCSILASCPTHRELNPVAQPQQEHGNRESDDFARLCWADVPDRPTGFFAGLQIASACRTLNRSRPSMRAGLALRLVPKAPQERRPDSSVCTESPPALQSPQSQHQAPSPPRRNGRAPHPGEWSR